MSTQQNYIYNKMNKDGSNSSINTLSFDTTYTPLLVSNGQIAWNGDEGTFNASLYEGAVLQLGQENHFYGVAVEDIPNGSVVMIAGVQGNRIKFAKATASAITDNPKVILGVATVDMVTNGYGYVTQFGNVNAIQTLAGWTQGNVLYYDIEYSYLKEFNTVSKPTYLTLLAKPYLKTKSASSTIVGSVATLYFSTLQASAPFAVGQTIAVRGVIASGATPTTCYQTESAVVTACTTAYVQYNVPAITGSATITTNGAVDAKTTAEYIEFNLMVSNVKNIVSIRTPGEVVWTGTGTIADPYLLNFTAFNAYLLEYNSVIDNGLLTNITPSGSLLKIPLATIILKSDNAPAGRLLVRPDIAYRFAQISDISINNLQNNDTIRYNAAGGYWFNTPAEVESTGYNPDNVYFASTIYANGGTIATETATTFNLINTQATTLNIGGAATAINLGAPTGTLTLNNPNIVGSNSTQNLFASASTTALNLGTYATILTIGATTGTLTLRNAVVKLPGVIDEVGDILYASNADGTLARLPKGTAGQFLKMNSGATAPEWGTVAVPGGLTAGSASEGFINYAGTTKTSGQWYGGTTAPAATTRLNYDGILWATQVYGAVFNDYAEFFIKDEELEAGDVIVKNITGEGYLKSKSAYDRKVIGVYSDTFGHILGADPEMSEEENLEAYAPVGLAGRVYVKVVGGIKVGDLLVSSNIPGVAMASEIYQAGTIIGKALQSYNSNTVGKIRMLIMNA